MAHYIVQARLLLEDIWRLSDQHWHYALQDEILTKYMFIEWSKKLPTMSEIEVPRSYFERVWHQWSFTCLVTVHKVFPAPLLTF